MTDRINESIGFRITSSDSLGHFYPKWFTLHSVLGFPGNCTHDLGVVCIVLYYVCLRNDFMAQATVYRTTLKVIFIILKHIRRSRRISFDIIWGIWYDSDLWAYLCLFFRSWLWFSSWSPVEQKGYFNVQTLSSSARIQETNLKWPGSCAKRFATIWKQQDLLSFLHLHFSFQPKMTDGISMVSEGLWGTIQSAWMSVGSIIEG